jgi:hypothetical protein
MTAVSPLAAWLLDMALDLDDPSSRPRPIGDQPSATASKTAIATANVADGYNGRQFSQPRTTLCTARSAGPACRLPSTLQASRVSQSRTARHADTRDASARRELLLHLSAQRLTKPLRCQDIYSRFNSGSGSKRSILFQGCAESSDVVNAIRWSDLGRPRCVCEARPPARRLPQGPPSHTPRRSLRTRGHSDPDLGRTRGDMSHS